MLRPLNVSGGGTASLSAELRVMRGTLAQGPQNRPKCWRGESSEESVNETMIRIFLIVVLAGLVVLAAAMVMLGTYPPDPASHSVEKVLPNDKFQSH